MISRIWEERSAGEVSVRCLGAGGVWILLVRSFFLGGVGVVGFEGRKGLVSVSTGGGM